MKTMALDIGGGGKVPAVGWIVATSGKHADQTFKLKPSRTLIGTGSDCDVVVEDQFMSSHHCEVRAENGNYKIVDLGSTNGIVVNDKKVREHELVDNDLFRLGRTEFKFKSIS
jgi:pSer/pThr/pTyr-binding forkhead associated (FHA) protein